MKSYKLFYGVSRSPFRKDVPVPALLRYTQFDELAAYLDFVAEEGSTGLLTGEAGVGKSTAIRAFLARLDDRTYNVCYVGNTDSTRSVLRQLAWSLGMRMVHLQGDLKDEVHQRIWTLWTEHAKRTILVVDEAQAFGSKALGELRLLTNFNCDADSPLGLLLAGAPSLRAEMKQLPNKALDERIMIRHHLAGLSAIETGQYVVAHLRAVDLPNDLFDDEAIGLVFQHSKGLPRKINKLCIQALIMGALKEVRPIDAAIIRAVVKDIDQE